MAQGSEVDVRGGQAASKLRVALVGAGIFAREAHLPAWLRLQERAQIVAVYARRAEAAQALADEIPYPVVIETDYARLLARPDLDAVDLVLPIDSQPAFVTQALAAGKHVISEKPAAPDVATARALIEAWQASGRVWMVAENWRYESAFQRAAELIAEGAIGNPITVSWLLNNPVNESNKYYHTAWRRSGDFPGGFLLDGGVHHVAVLRLLLGEVEAVQAFVRQVRPDLPPADTLSATLRFASGALGAYTVTYAAPHYAAEPMEIMGTKGRLRVDRGLLQLIVEGETRDEKPALRDGVDGELAAFIAAVLDGAAHINTPEQGLTDVAVVAAMLESARTGQLQHVA